MSDLIPMLNSDGTQVTFKGHPMFWSSRLRFDEELASDLRNLFRRVRYDHAPHEITPRFRPFEPPTHAEMMARYRASRSSR